MNDYHILKKDFALAVSGLNRIRQFRMTHWQAGKGLLAGTGRSPTRSLQAGPLLPTITLQAGIHPSAVFSAIAQHPKQHDNWPAGRPVPGDQSTRSD